jgi:hypothetical protein
MRAGIVLNGYFSHAFIVVAFSIYYTHDNPDGLTYIFTTEFYIRSELCVVSHSGWAPTWIHPSGLVFYDATIVITAVIDICGIQFGSTVVV